MIYFDNAATTPCSKKVLAVMQPYFSEKYGNPSSIYRIGREAKEALERAREEVANILGAKSREIVFTSGATEANNLAIMGAAEAGAYALNGRPHLITSQIEHHSVLDVFKHLEKSFGAEVTYLSVSQEGLIDLNELRGAIKENTILVSVMMGNNEIGSVQPIGEISKIISEKRAQRKEIPLYFHTDAVQAFQYLDSKIESLGVDLLSLTAHKFHGPKGVGLLYVKSNTKISPQQLGGAQERRMRAGTENVPYIVGMAEAMQLANINRLRNREKVKEVVEYLSNRIMTEIPETEILGSRDESKKLPHIATFIFKRIEGESILINLDLSDIAASSGSACTSGSLEPSHVTKAMGYGDMEAHGAIRFSLGTNNTKEEVDKLMEVLPGIVEKLRAMSPVE